MRVVTMVRQIVQVAFSRLIPASWRYMRRAELAQGRQMAAERCMFTEKLGQVRDRDSLYDGIAHQ